MSGQPASPNDLTPQEKRALLEKLLKKEPLKRITTRELQPAILKIWIPPPFNRWAAVNRSIFHLRRHSSDCGCWTNSTWKPRL